jgi:hypothetical protein
VKRRPPVVIIRKRAGAASSQDAPKTSESAERPARRSSEGSSRSGQDGRRSSRGPERRSGGPNRGGGKPQPKWKQERGPDPEKLARRKAAEELAESAGIPVPYAHRILQGQTTLNDVLQKLMRKAKLEGLVRDEGLDPSLAGQVAAGKLKLERAKVIHKMRQLRPHSVAKDGFALASETTEPVALQCFGGSWLSGHVTEAEIYEFDFKLAGTDETQRMVKHDVKMIVLAGEASVDALFGIDQEVATQGLEGTGEAAQRIKVPEDVLLDAVAQDSTLSLVCRDGTTVRGKVVCFSRWDIELSVPPLTGGDAVSVIVFNHSLHPKSAKSPS